MGKLLYDFITEPLSLPIHPILEIVVLAFISEKAYRSAYETAGTYGDSSLSRYIIHWFSRPIIYIGFWLIACAIIAIIKFVRKHFIISLVIFTVLIVAVCTFMIVTYFKTRKYKKNADLWD